MADGTNRSDRSDLRDPYAEPRVFNKHHGHPKDAVYVGRGSPWGNPYVIGQHGDREQVCDLFEVYAIGKAGFLEAVRRELKGKHLVCFCKPARCHADFLLRVANGQFPPKPEPPPQSPGARPGKPFPPLLPPPRRT